MSRVECCTRTGRGQRAWQRLAFKAKSSIFTGWRSQLGHCQPQVGAGLCGRGCNIVRKCELLLLEGDALFAKRFLVTFNLGAIGCKFTHA